MPITDADRLAAEGIPLTLGDHELRIIFRNRAKKELERRFGSLVHFERALNLALALAGEGPIVTVCLDGLGAALVGQPILDQRGQQVGRWTDDLVDAALGPDPDDYIRVRDAIEQAWLQAWPAAAGEDDRGNADGTPANSSPGSSTSSSPSSEASPLTSSGT